MNYQLLTDCFLIGLQYTIVNFFILSVTFMIIVKGFKIMK